MSRASVPKPTWEILKTDPLGWKLRYVANGVLLGEPAYLKGEVPVDNYPDATHLLWDHGTLPSLLVRKQGQNPIEIRIGEPGIDGTPPPWIPLSQAPYFGPVDENLNPKKPVFPTNSIWSSWN